MLKSGQNVSFSIYLHLHFEINCSYKLNILNSCDYFSIFYNIYTFSKNWAFFQKRRPIRFSFIE